MRICRLKKPPFILNETSKPPPPSSLPGTKFLARAGTSAFNRFHSVRLDGAAMPEYHVYVIGEDGHIKLRIDLNCADDDLAKEQAKSVSIPRQSRGL